MSRIRSRRRHPVHLAALLGLLVATAGLAGAPPAAADPGGSTRIVAGTPARIEAFPSTVRVVIDRGATIGLCGGTLIAPTKVVTAQHCVVDDAASAITVTIGRTDWASDLAGERIGVTAVRRMPGYAFPRNDAAVLTLTRASAGQVTRLATSGSPFVATGNSATAAGWGATATGGEQSPTLLRAGLTLRADSVCNYTGYDAASNLCASAPASSDRNTCQGDSGGPLYTTGPDGRLELLGVTSGGSADGCGSRTGPSFYADAATGPVHDFLAADAVSSSQQFAAYRSNVVAYNVAGGVRTVRVDNAVGAVLASGGELQSPHAFVARGTTVLLRDTAGDGSAVFVENARTHAVTPSFTAADPGSVGYAGNNAAYTYAATASVRHFTVVGTAIDTPALLGVAAPTRASRVAYRPAPRPFIQDQVTVKDTTTGRGVGIAVPAGWTVTDVAFQPDLKLVVSLTNLDAGNGETYECTPALSPTAGALQPLSSCTVVLQTTTAARIATFERGSQALLAYTQDTTLLLLDRNTGISRQLATGVTPNSAIAVGPKV